MIFIMRSASCSGKDTFIEKHFKPHCVLSSDAFRLQLLDDVTDQSKNAAIFQHLRDVLTLRLRFGNAYTVINATNLKYKDVEPYIQIAEVFAVPVTIISIEPPTVEELVNRAAGRGAAGGLNTELRVLEKHYNAYYNCLPRFEELAREGLFKLIRIDQDYEVVDEI